MTINLLIAKFGWPRCAKCDKPVERMFEDRDVRTGAVVISVKCHGETETVSASPETFLAPDQTVRFVEAFTGNDKQLAPPARELTDGGTT